MKTSSSLPATLSIPKRVRSAIVALALVASAAACASGDAVAASPTSGPSQLDELDEVLVNGQKPATKPSKVISWMQRLVGQFSYEGIMDLRGTGTPEDNQLVKGWSNCIGFGAAPGVLCEVNVRWPESKEQDSHTVLGEVPKLFPAMTLYGLEPQDTGVRFMQVDSIGIAEPGLGILYGDTLISKQPCVRATGICQKNMRITALPEGERIDIQIDIEIDYILALRLRAVLNRVSSIQAEEFFQQ